MRFAQGMASAIALLLAIAAGLIADAHPWAAVLSVVIAILFTWFAVQDPKAPPPVERTPFRWPDDDVK